MSSIGGSPVEHSLLQTAQAQQAASKARDREKAATERKSRYQDLVDLRVAGVEDAEAVRRLPQNESEQAESEHQRQSTPEQPARDGDEEPPHVDVEA